MLFSKILFKDWLIISMLQILITFTIVVICKSLILISLLFPKYLRMQDNSEDRSKYCYSSDELLNKAAKTNNQTMYNYYTNHKEEVKAKLNSKYMCLAMLLLVI
jgi:hypothetical protein